MLTIATPLSSARTPLLGELGVRLRELRLDAGLTGSELAARCEVTQPTISKIERGRMVMTPETLDRLLTELKASDSVRQELHTLLKTATVFGRELRHHAIQSAGHAAIVYRERLARHVRCFAPMVLPALLQTSLYTEHLAADRPWFAHSADVALGQRLDRQGLLCDLERTFEFILTEAALTFGPAADAARRAQDERLTSLIRLPNVRIRVVRREAAMRRLTLPWCAFTIYDDDAVAISTFIDDTLVAEPADIAAYTAAFVHLTANARDLTDRNTP
jgi:transcriptional regulator with XRE-family HTH domain